MQRYENKLDKICVFDEFKLCKNKDDMHASGNNTNLKVIYLKRYMDIQIQNNNLFLNVLLLSFKD